METTSEGFRQLDAPVSGSAARFSRSSCSATPRCSTTCAPRQTRVTRFLTCATSSTQWLRRFLATSLAVDRFFGAFRRVRKYYRMIEIVAGLLMVIIGVLLVVDRFSLIVRALQPYLPTF